MTSLADTAHLQAPAATASAGTPEVVPLSTPARETTRRHGIFLPVLLPGLALGAWLGLQAELALSQRTQLEVQLGVQESSLSGAQRVRAAADALARSTQTLADAGNPQAQLLVGELRRRGVTLKSLVPSS